MTKSLKHYSSISIEQAHKQNNELLKGDGGANSLMENSMALLCWMVSGPEIDLFMILNRPKK